MATPKAPEVFDISFSDGLALTAVAITVVLVVLDKAGKLRGPVLFILLAMACAMLIPLATGNAWVSATDGSVRVFRSMLGCCIIATAYTLLSLWISTSESLPKKEGAQIDPLSYSLNVLTPAETALFLDHSLERGQAFYRFKINNNSPLCQHD